jgi:hypothetical protein
MEAHLLKDWHHFRLENGERRSRECGTDVNGDQESLRVALPRVPCERNHRKCW